MKKILILLLLFIPFSFSVNAKDYGWGLVPSKNHEAPDPGPIYQKLIDDHNAFYIGNSNLKTIYLTFDMGYENGNTSAILDCLKEENVNACFFVTGHYLKNNPELILRMAKEGHIVGNHTWSHPKITKLSYDELALELSKVEDLYTKITGREMSKFARAPEGLISDEALTNFDNLGYTSVYWSLAYKDWNHDNGWEYSYNYVMEHIHNGAIILMHAVSKDNAQALKKILIDLKKEGYQFASLENLYLD